MNLLSTFKKALEIKKTYSVSVGSYEEKCRCHIRPLDHVAPVRRSRLARILPEGGLALRPLETMVK